MKVSQLISALRVLQDEHGDLDVFYASSYDWAMPIKEASVETDTNWDNAPINGEPAIFLN